MNKLKVWVFKDGEGILRPMAGLWLREGRIAEYVQPDIDKFMAKNGADGEIVKAEIIETDEKI